MNNDYYEEYLIIDNELEKLKSAAITHGLKVYTRIREPTSIVDFH